MAVYKATYCYPFLNSFDGRVTATSEDSTPSQNLKCKIESSNKLITGYTIEIYDENNTRIFPYSDTYKKISPILELPQLGDNINSGYNGTYLQIPFFQNWSNPVKKADGTTFGSYNAVYYVPRFSAQYLLSTDVSATGVENIDNWSYDSGNNELYYEGFDGILNEELVINGDLVFSMSTSPDKGGMWFVNASGRLSRYTPKGTGDGVDITYIINHAAQVTITQGNHHGEVYKYDSGASAIILSTGAHWVDYYGHTINFNNEGTNYKWVITLYQSPELGHWSGSVFVPDYRQAATGILKTSSVSSNVQGITKAFTLWYCDYSGMPID